MYSTRSTVIIISREREVRSSEIKKKVFKEEIKKREKARGNSHKIHMERDMGNSPMSGEMNRMASDADSRD